MAINKRKESVALFELIDKSTLKIPKNAGSLKIPAWWSSEAKSAAKAKANAASAETANGKLIHREVSSADEMALQDRNASENIPAVESPAEMMAAQNRLFEPPPANVAPVSSPSIRPPPPASSPSVTVRAAASPVKTMTATGTTSPGAVVKKIENVSRGEPVDKDVRPKNIGPAATRIFAPLTQVQNTARRPWSPPRAGSFARLPPWVVFSTIGGLLFAVCVIVFLAKSGGSKEPEKTSTVSVVNHATAVDNSAARSILPPSLTYTPVNNAPTVKTGISAKPVSPAPVTGSTLIPPAQTTGRVYRPGEFRSRSPDLYYVVILSSLSPDIAQKDAEFIAQHGVDVAIETQQRSGKMWYTLVSVQGFSSVSQGQPLRDHIVAIGHLTNDYKKSKKAWDDAMIVHVTPSAAH